MHKLPVVTALWLSLMACPWASASPASPVDAVNTYIGTGGGGTEYGGTMPFVQPPFAMTSWTPQTRQDRIASTSYAWEDSSISGFIGTHQPAIWMGDYGYVTLMPEIDQIKTRPEDRQLAFTHAHEQTTPYYYSVSMDAPGGRVVRTEMTSTMRCALMRFTYPQNSLSSVVVEATRPGVAGFASFNQAAGEITGYNPDRMDSHLGPFKLPHFKGYFVVQFNRRVASGGTYQGTSLAPSSPSVTGDNVGAYAAFNLKPGETVEARIGTSFLSIEQARDNLRRELPGWNMTELSKTLRNQWNRQLGRVTIEGGTPDQRIEFETGLYHALLYPRTFSEYGRYYSAFDDSIHNGESYTAYSIWDTFRAEFSLLTLIAPERVDGMVQALLQNYQEGGWMPKWPNPSETNIMIATHADSLVAEAITKGFHGFDHALAYRAVYQDAMVPPIDDTRLRYSDREPNTPMEARAGLTYSRRLGYIPVDKTAEAASSTLEDAYDDWCVAQVARDTGNDGDYRFFLDRSRNYRNLYNSDTGFMQGRNMDGTWASPKDGWTEGDNWAYTWCVMQDVPGLITLMGGPQKFNDRLDAHFSGGHNNHSNEPCHHYPYLYTYSGQPWKTQLQVRTIETQLYSNTVKGVEGNEDCGQMSAWYVLSSLGFYPVNPASGEYRIGSPLFDRATLHLANGRTFTVSCSANSPANLYIQSATLNREPLRVPAITWTQIMSGGTLHFVMGPAPSTWGAGGDIR